MRRIPEMWYGIKRADCGLYIEMEFTHPPMGVVFQVRQEPGVSVVRAEVADDDLARV